MLSFLQDDLRAFHVKHFPHAPAPEHFLHGVEATEENQPEEDDGLGYYSDGKKRTLTDEQIAIFRHSEIQAILRKRRQRRDAGELSEDGEASDNQAQAAVNTASAPSDAPERATSDTDNVQSGRIEKASMHSWTTSSARTKAKNKRNKLKYQAKKKARRQAEELRQKEQGQEVDDDEESDEWDPWHQANGPDVQKDEGVELEY